MKFFVTLLLSVLFLINPVLATGSNQQQNEQQSGDENSSDDDRSYRDRIEDEFDKIKDRVRVAKKSTDFAAYTAMMTTINFQMKFLIMTTLRSLRAILSRS